MGKGNTDRKWRISAFEVIGLFDQFNHRIHFGAKEKFKILYGQNGVGKTKFLELLDALCQFDHLRILEVPFSSAKITFENGNELGVTRILKEPNPAKHSKPSKASEKIWTIKYFFEEKSGIKHSYEIPEIDTEEWLVRNTRLNKSAASGLMKDPFDGLFDEAQIIRTLSREISRSVQMPQEFKNISNSIATYLIDTRRLDTLNSDTSFGHKRRLPPRISRLSEEMKLAISSAETEHSRISQQLDRNFVQRAITAKRHESSIDALRKDYKELSEVKNLIADMLGINVEEMQEPDFSSAAEELVPVLDLYVDDTKLKLQPLMQVAYKIMLFTKLIDSRLAGKQIVANMNDGIGVIRDKDQHRLELRQLSSGEKHLIVLYFHLLFSVEKESLVLIDEPEISLNTVWQSEFLRDVCKISEHSDFRFLVATHSESIIAGEWEAMTPLTPDESLGPLDQRGE